MTKSSRLLRAFFQGFFFGVVGALFCHMNGIVYPGDKPDVNGEAMLEVRRLRAANNDCAEEGL